MAKSYWLINSNRTEVKRFVKNNKSIDGVFEYMFVYERLISQGWRKTEEVWIRK